MATATAERTARPPSTPDELLMALAEDAKPVAALLRDDPKLESALALAWVLGDVEFGRVCHCVTGRPGVPESKPTLLIEDGTDWTGAKTPKHEKFAKLKADAERLPACSEYKKYVKQVMVGKDDQGVERWRVATADELKEIADGREFRWTTQAVNRDEAARHMALYVRLTDKGAAALQVA